MSGGTFRWSTRLMTSPAELRVVLEEIWQHRDVAFPCHWAGWAHPSSLGGYYLCYPVVKLKGRMTFPKYPRRKVRGSKK